MEKGNAILTSLRGEGCQGARQKKQRVIRNTEFVSYLAGFHKELASNSHVTSPDVAVVRQGYGCQIQPGNAGVRCPAADQRHGCQEQIYVYELQGQDLGLYLFVVED